MTIKINLDLILLKKKIKLVDLAPLVGISTQNLSILKNGRAKALRISTLNKLCKHLTCKPGDLLDYEEKDDDDDDDDDDDELD